MRVLFSAPAIPNVTQRLANGQSVRGSLQFRATLWDPGERVDDGHHAELLSTWRRDSFTQPDGSMRVPVSPASVADGSGALPAAIIPAELLRDVPDDARLEVSWNLRPGGPQ